MATAASSRPPGSLRRVEHQALQLGLSLHHLFELAGEVVHGAFLELRHAQPAIAGLDHLGLDALRLDFFAGDGDREGAVLVLAEDTQRDLGVGLPAHALDRIVDAQSLDRRVVNFGDQIVGFQTGAERG
jgi:hypothetical protein